MKELSQLIEPDILAQLDNDLNQVTINSEKLSLTHNRFDLAFKLYFLQGLAQSEFSEFRRACYRQHIKAFSDGTFSEPNNPHKNTYQHFEQTLIELLAEITANGFNEEKSLVPLASDGSILNGAHRTSVAILLNKNVSTLHTSLAPRDFGFEYFKSRGVTEAMLDTAAQTFIAHDNKCFLAFIWPAAKGADQEIAEILHPLVYQKSISLTYNGAHNLLAQAYSQEPWLGNEADNFPGIKNKLVGCFPNFDDVRVYLFKADSLENVLSLKDRVRALFNLGKHAIHITDNQEETLRLGRLVFNDNALHFLNNAKPRAFSCFTKQQTIEFAQQQKLLNENLTMHLYGLSAINDVNNGQYADLTSVAALTGIAKQELADNPAYHFYYNNMKVMSLALVKQIKKQRKTQSDLQALALIAPLMKKNRIKPYLDQIKSRLYFIKIRAIASLKTSVASMLKKLGLFELVKRILNANK